MFDAGRFARCKDGAILLNVGRGTTVDSDALVDALRSGKIFGAGLDVTDPEPLPADHPLPRSDMQHAVEHRKSIVSVGGYVEMRRKSLRTVQRKSERCVRRVFRGESIDDLEI